MQEIKELTNFYSAISDDHRIGATHIAVYMALFQLYNLNGFANPICMKRSIIMSAAKISGIATFHKCMKDLHDYKYIVYEPSCNPKVGCKVFILG